MIVFQNENNHNASFLYSLKQPIYWKLTTRLIFLQGFSSWKTSDTYLHRKNLSTLRKSSFIDKLKVTGWSQINQYSAWASLNCIMAAICWGSNSQCLLRYSGVMTFQTILAINLIPSFATFRLTALKRLNES